MRMRSKKYVWDDQIVVLWDMHEHMFRESSIKLGNYVVKLLEEMGYDISFDRVKAAILKTSEDYGIRD